MCLRAIMALKQVIDASELLDGFVDGRMVAETLKDAGIDDIVVERVSSSKGSTDFIRVRIKGTDGRMAGGDVPTLGIVGRLGGIGARPERIGLVSDADGAIVAVATALKVAQMARRGDRLPGDVVIATHICPNAPTIPHNPVPFMDSPVDMATLNKYEVSGDMDAVLTVDTTKGNRVLNHRGVAITPTVMKGYILPISEDLLDILSRVTGKLPEVLPITMFDITPYGNGLPHINSIMQPAIATDKPVVGVAITAQTPVAGCATGASHETDIAEAVRFCIETAKEMKRGLGIFCDREAYEKAVRLYGDMEVLQNGKAAGFGAKEGSGDAEGR